MLRITLGSGRGRSKTKVLHSRVWAFVAYCVWQHSSDAEPGVFIRQEERFKVGDKGECKGTAAWGGFTEHLSLILMSSWNQFRELNVASYVEFLHNTDSLKGLWCHSVLFCGWRFGHEIFEHQENPGEFMIRHWN